MAERVGLDLDWLHNLHAAKRLALATTVGLEGYVELKGDRHGVVDELIRLARLGQHAEQLVMEQRRNV